MNSINSKKNDINDLVTKIEVYIQNNKEKPIKIDNVLIFYTINFFIKFNIKNEFRTAAMYSTKSLK